MSPEMTRTGIRPDETIVIEGHLPPEAAGWSTKSLRYLPFDVPEGVSRIAVHREIEPLERQVIALLVYDPRGHGPGASGFRGYQGQVNIDTDFVLTEDPATTTPWYQPGPLPPGRWHLAHWYVRPTDGGLRYRYTVTLSFDERTPDGRTEASFDASRVARSGAGWYAGSMHNHTVYSYDSSIGGEPYTPSGLVARQREAGYDFIVITDHNQPRSHGDLAGLALEFPDTLVLRGNELTTLHGHANQLGIAPGSCFDFRLDPGDGRLPGIIAEAHRQGALFVVNHPFQVCPDCPWRFPEDEWGDADVIEVWNRTWQKTNRQAVDWWDAMLKAGRRIPVLGGSDYHRGPAGFSPATWVYADGLSQPAVLEALRRGRAFVSEGPDGVWAELTANEGSAMMGDTAVPNPRGTLPVEVRIRHAAGMTLRLVWREGETCLPIEAGDVVLLKNVTAGAERGYVRAEVLKPNGDMAALTNAIYVD